MKKTIKFFEPISVDPSMQGLRHSFGRSWERDFHFKMVDSSLVDRPEQESRTSIHDLRVKASVELVTIWRFDTFEAPGRGPRELVKVLYKLGKERYIIHKLKAEGDLPKSGELVLNMKDDAICPDPNEIEDPEGATFEVEMGDAWGLIGRAGS